MVSWERGMTWDGVLRCEDHEAGTHSTIEEAEACIQGETSKPGIPLTEPQPDRPMPTFVSIWPGFTSRAQELAQAFREAVALVHEHGVEHPHPFAKRHLSVEDDDYNCDHPWCVRFWAMVREAEDAAR